MANSNKQALKAKKAKARRERLRLAQAKRAEAAQADAKPEDKAAFSFDRRDKTNEGKRTGAKTTGPTIPVAHRTQGK